MIRKNFFKFWPLFVFTFMVLLFFYPFWLKGKLPIPSDTVVGMYHPWRDKVWDNFINGVPFKNYLITDPVRQQIPWRQLAVAAFKRGELPVWNPYSLAGMPLLANFQSALFYPLNLLFAVFQFPLAWSILILLQPLLAGIFLYLYLRQLKLAPIACLLGAVCFSFSGFFIAWLEWGTLLHSALWLPLILLAIDKILLRKKKFVWGVILAVALCSSFFAGHLQTAFYVFLISFVYCFWQLYPRQKRKELVLILGVVVLFFILITLVQSGPTLQLIKLSARGADQADWQKAGWFLPWQHLVQFLVPDFFGNPTTLNYWGTWNYAELVGFIGVIPLFFLLGLIRKNLNRETIFFLILGLVALSFALPTPWARLVYQLRLPFLSTAQPTRLLLIVDFSLAVLSAMGMSLFLKEKKLGRVWLVLPLIFILLWLLVILVPRIWPGIEWVNNLSISRRNLILPSGMLLGGLVLIYLVGLKNKVLTWLAIAGLLLLTGFDLLRFGWKFTPFIKPDWLFPPTEVIKFLQADTSVFRIMAIDDRIMPPNFASFYQLQEVGGYDPLYLLRYGELIAALERNEPNIRPPFGFNRILTPKNYASPLVDLLNVKYVLSLTGLNSDKLELVFQEGETRVYQNLAVLPRAFLVYDYRLAANRQEAIDLLFNSDLSKAVILEEDPNLAATEAVVPGSVTIKVYLPQKVELEVETSESGILVLTDSFYPDWQAAIDGQETKILRANYHFRAIIIPKGKHLVVFAI